MTAIKLLILIIIVNKLHKHPKHLTFMVRMFYAGSAKININIVSYHIYLY